MELIDKSAVVAEIERLKKCNRKICGGDFDFLKKAYPKHYYSTEIYNDILSFLDTLEVEEVDMPALDNENMPIKRWKEVCKAASCQANYRKSKGLTETCDDYFVDGVQWADEHPIKMKDVDLDKEARHYLLYEHESPLVTILHQVDLMIEMQYHRDIENAFKAGVELGIKTQKGDKL